MPTELILSDSRTIQLPEPKTPGALQLWPRLDKHIFGAKCPNTVIDIKKCQSGKLGDYWLQKAIREYAWDVQAAWYTDGAERVTGEKHLFAWVFMEDSEPFDVRPLWASRRMLAVGQAKASYGFEMYKYCIASGRWPGICEDIEEMDPADFECKRYGVN